MKISKEFAFEASHILPHHQGKCRNLHGHSWRLVAELEGEINPADHFVLDFYELGLLIKPIINLLDHSHLNYLLSYPTSEALTMLILHTLRRLSYPGELRISVSETQKSWASATLGDLRASNWDYISRLISLPSPVQVVSSTIVKPSLAEVKTFQERWQRVVDSVQGSVHELNQRKGTIDAASHS